MEFIEMVADLSERRFLRKMQSLTDSKTPCGIFLTPDTPKNIKEIFRYLKAAGINLNFICVLTVQQKEIFRSDGGETVFALEEFPHLSDKPKFIFVFERYYGTAFKDYFKAFGTDMFFLPYVDAAENLYNLYMKNLPALYDVHEMLADDRSKKIFRAAITGRITRLMQDFIYTTEHEYFLNGFLPAEGDIAIDGGAYDGATAADFVRQGAKVYAFEMDKSNYERCLPAAEKFGFTIENFGLSDKERENFYAHTGVGSHKVLQNTGLVAKFIDLDTYVEKKNLPRVDYIKLDIEGAELEALRGAAKTISRWKPKMAICAYHKPEDLWTLATYIKFLRSDYEFQFRHHYTDRSESVKSGDKWAALRYFDLSYRTPSEYEMILYCR